MKILHVVQGYIPAIGGTEHLIQRVSEELVSQFGDEVTVFTTNCYSAEAFSMPQMPRMPAGWETINGVRVRRFPVSSHLSRPFGRLSRNLRLLGSQYFRTLYNGPIIPGLGRAIFQADYDVAVAASFPLLHMYTTLWSAHLSRRPCVYIGCLHPADAWGYDRSIIYRAIKKADSYVALTRHEGDYIASRRIPPHKITVIGVGTDLQRFQGVEQLQARQRLGISQDIPLVGFIGQVAWRKGVETLLRAMRQVWQAFPNAHVLIAGAKTVYADRLSSVIAELPLEERQKVILRYNFPDEEKPWLFGALDVFAYPSGYESFGIAYLEAWAVGKPVIGCQGGAVPFVIDAGRDGLLVPFDHHGLLAEAILTLLSNPEWACRLGEQGRLKVHTRYNWPEIARCFRQVYRQAVDHKRSSRPSP